MRKTMMTLAVASLTLPFAWACASDGSSGPSAAAPGSSTTASAPATTTTASTSGTSGTGAGAAAPSGSSAGKPASTGLGGIPALVSVNLQNVLNDLAVKLNIDRANVPINAQVPIQLAANVCGVSVNVLSVSTGGQANCTAKSAPQDLAQVVQQQMAAGGSVGGGAQGGSTAATGGTTNSAPANGGASNTSADSVGAHQ